LLYTHQYKWQEMVFSPLYLGAGYQAHEENERVGNHVILESSLQSLLPDVAVQDTIDLCTNVSMLA